MPKLREIIQQLRFNSRSIEAAFECVALLEKMAHARNYGGKNELERDLDVA